MSPDAGDVGRKAISVFAGADWYIERDEPERTWRGVLRRRSATGGPADRAALAFALVTADGPIPAYAAGVERLLGGFDEQTVVVRGKLVDLAAEGFAPELWIGAIEADGSRTGFGSDDAGTSPAQANGMGGGEGDVTGSGTDGPEAGGASQG